MKEPLKIIIFDGSFKTTPFINRLVQGLAKRHEVYILGFNVELTHKLERVHYVPLGSNQIKFRFVKTSLSYAFQSGSVKNILSTIKLLFKMERHQLQEQNLRFTLNKIQPNIIHLQWPSVIPWFEEVLNSQEIPVVLSQRGTQNNVRPFIYEEDMEYLQKWYPKVLGFHSVSNAIAINGNKIWGSSKKLDRTIYTGLPLQHLSFSEPYSRENPLQLISVGRTYWIKGYNYALQACKLLKENSLAFHYTIIGGAGDEELQFLISDLELQECVTLLGRIPQSEVFDRMRRASLLLLPSVEEGIPNVVVEAMALGLPVLSTDCGGVTELIEEGVQGWLVAPRKPNALAEVVLAFSRLSLDKIGEVRLAARKKVEKQHSEEAMVNGMEELYYEVLGRKIRV